MVVPLSFTVNLYHDGVFQVNPLQYVNFDSKVIDDVSFDACYENNLKIDLFTEHNGYDIMEMIDEELHPKKPVSHVDLDSDVETNHPLDDLAHVVEQFQHENEAWLSIMLSEIPCVHAIAGYMHMKMNPDLGVDEWYSQCEWYEAYQFSIKPVYGPKFWKPTSQPPPLPSVERKMPGRPRQMRIRHPTEDEDHAVAVNKVGPLSFCVLYNKNAIIFLNP
ncbi:hypothetical protein Tco_1191883 [Tanacetum coccineum]